MLANRVRMGVGSGDIDWYEIQSMVKAGTISEVLSLGDELVSKYNNEKIVWQVIGFNVDKPTNTRLKNSLTLQTKDCIDERQFHNVYAEDRYHESIIRGSLNLEYYNNLESDLKNVIVEVQKRVAISTLWSGTQKIFNDKIFLLSQKEANFGDEGNVTGEFIYPFYAQGGSRVKKLNGSPSAWWLRSPMLFAPDEYVVRRVNVRGDDAYNAYANDPQGIAPALVIA